MELRCLTDHIDDEDRVYTVIKSSHIISLHDVTRTVYSLKHQLQLDGIPSRSATRICIVVSELGTNMVKYAGTGTIDVHMHTDRNCIRVRATDHGPGIRDVEMAIKDGHTDKGPVLNDRGLNTHGSKAMGLSAVDRIASKLEIQSSSSGTTVTVRISLMDDSGKPDCIENESTMDVGIGPVVSR